MKLMCIRRRKIMGCYCLIDCQPSRNSVETFSNRLSLFRPSSRVPARPTKYNNLYQINRKTNFQPSVCTPYSYFILYNKTIVECSGKYVCHDWLAEVQWMDMSLVICNEFGLVEIRYIAHRRGAGAHGLGQGINHLITETEILFPAQCSI